MRTLIVAATNLEIKPALEHFAVPSNSPVGKIIQITDAVDVLISGVGPLEATGQSSIALSSKKYLAAYNFGIGASFRKQFPIGSAVQVVSEINDEGAETQNGFDTLEDLKLRAPNDFPFAESRLVAQPIFPNFLPDMPKVHGVTVHKAIGRAETLKIIQEKFDPDVVSMEGASFFYAAIITGTPAVQVRTISNEAGVRDKSLWNIPLAVATLNKILIELITSVG